MGSSVHLPAFVTSPGVGCRVCGCTEGLSASAVTGGYFHKLLQFLELSCIALASLVTANGASVAGCGPREAAELLRAGEESHGVLGGLLVWECS